MYKIGDTVDFDFQATSECSGKLSDFRGKKVVLYFYPRDNTPGCTQESQDFTSMHDKFVAANTVILGLSRDSLRTHERFKAKYDMPFELITDQDETICGLFDIVIDKNMYGKKVRGIVRSTFIFDENGVLTHEWRKVKVPDHVSEVLAAL